MGGDRQLNLNHSYNGGYVKKRLVMQSIYRLKAEELNADFLEGLKLTFKDRQIEIIVSVVGDELEVDASNQVQESIELALQEVKAGKTSPIEDLWVGIDE